MYTQGERNKSKTSEPVETGKSWAGYIYSPNLKMLLHFFSTLSLLMIKSRSIDRSNRRRILSLSSPVFLLSFVSSCLFLDPFVFLFVVVVVLGDASTNTQRKTQVYFFVYPM